MAVCPKCKSQIDHLVEWCPEYVPYCFRLIDNAPDEEAHHDLETEPIGSHKINTDYCCPQCQEIITTDRDEAVKVLRE